MDIKALAWMLKYPKVMPRYSIGTEKGISYVRFGKARLLHQVSSGRKKMANHKFLIFKKEDYEKDQSFEQRDNETEAIVKGTKRSRV